MNCRYPQHWLFPSFLFVLLWIFVAVPHPLHAQPTTTTRDVAAGLSVPVQVLWGADSMLWVAERAGRILQINPESGEQTELLQVPDVFLPEERGIFGMAMHPDFKNSPDIFLFYSYVNFHDQGWDLWGKVVRYSYNSTEKKLGEPTVILDSLSTMAWNFGGGILALPDETLLVGIGDGIDFLDEVQSHSSTRGKILRVGFDGSIPEDNPWKTSSSPLDALWATGFRNPKGLDVGPDGTVYGTDWGTASLDEINIIQKGGNYGWPNVLGTCDGHPFLNELEFCQDSNVVEPLHQWYKAEVRVTMPADLRYYSGSIIDHWDHSLLVATLDDGLHQVKLTDEGRVEYVGQYLVPDVDPDSPGRLRAVCVSPEGRVFVATSNQDGEARPPFPGAADDRIVEVLSAKDLSDDTTTTTPLIVRDIITNLHVPWEITWGTDNWIWMTERNGAVGKVNPEDGEYRQLLNLPDVVETGSAGLLGMALHPNFCDSPHVFLVYCYERPDNSALLWEKLVRYTYMEDIDTLVEPVVLVDSIEATGNHAGSRVIISPDRKIFMTTSDADKGYLTQSLQHKHGKILRLNIDGSVPHDNPWRDSPWPGNIVWSMGHRNPQGLVFASNHILYSAEHGPWSDDEINLISKGNNYGWPDVAGFCDTPGEQDFCADSVVTEPLIAWTPTIAPSGLDYYSSNAIPEWTGSLLLAVLKRSQIVQVQLNEHGNEVDTTNLYFSFDFGRIRDLCVAPDGRVFLAVSNADGIGVPKEGDDRIVEIRSGLGHPALPEPGELCDRILTGVDSEVELVRSGATVLPQPVHDYATILLGTRLAQGTAKIYNLSGVLIREEEFPGGNSWQFARHSLKPGLYLVKLSDSAKVVQVQVVVR